MEGRITFPGNKAWELNREWWIEADDHIPATQQSSCLLEDT